MIANGFDRRAAPEANLHNIDPEGLEENHNGEALQDNQPATGTTSTAVPSTETSSAANMEGTWGERDVGGPVNQRMAMEDYEAMRRELTTLSQTRSRSSARGDGPGLVRTITSRSRMSSHPEPQRTRSSRGATTSLSDDEDLEAGDAQAMAGTYFAVVESFDIFSDSKPWSHTSAISCNQASVIIFALFD